MGLIQNQQTYDMIVVGGGVAGLTLVALLNAQAQAAGVEPLRIAVIDRQVSQNNLVQPAAPQQIPSAASPLASTMASAFDPRVVALSPRSINILRAGKVWSILEQRRRCPYFNMRVWDANGCGEIHFDHNDIHQDYLGYILENRELISALRQVTALPHVQFIEGALTQIEDVPHSHLKRVSLSNGMSFNSSFIVGADGAQSQVRQQCGFSTRQWSYGHTAIVTTVKTARPHAFTCWQAFMPQGPLAFLPLNVLANPADRSEYLHSIRENGEHSAYSSIVWSTQTAHAETLMALDDNAFCRALSRHSGYRLGDVLSTDKRWSFPLNQCHAKYYVQPSVALVGDAAHSIHPLAGQGANLGLYDVDVLAREILRGQKKALPLGDLGVLQRYQRQRMGQNLLAMTAMEGFKRLFEPDQLLLNWVRNRGLSHLNRWSGVKKYLMNVAAG